MTNSDIADRLHLTASRIAQWKLDARRLSAILHERPGRLEPLVMLDVEETSGAIYREIDAFEAPGEDIEAILHDVVQIARDRLRRRKAGEA